jgi:hypothetical protein
MEQQAELIAELRAEIRAERDRYAALVDKMTTLQRVGLAIPTTVEAPAPTGFPSGVVAAIAAHMEPTSVPGRLTAQQARIWLKDGMDLKDVVARIHAGAGGE